MLGQAGEDVDRELFCVGHVGTYELDLALLQLSDEVQVAAQTVELCNHQCCTGTLARCNAFFSFGRSSFLPVSTSTYSATSFHGPAIQVISDSSALRLKANAAAALFSGGNAAVADEFACFRAHYQIP